MADNCGSEKAEYKCEEDRKKKGASGATEIAVYFAYTLERDKRM